jgi:hypothetical protein
MKTFSTTAETDLRADASISRELLSGGDTIAVSERAKRQIGSQASEDKANFANPKLQGPNFLEGFPDTFPDGPSLSSKR